MYDSENKKNPKVSIVVPCYNEEKNIDRFKSEFIDYLDSEDLDYEVIFIEDGSSKDDTWGALKRLKEVASSRVRVYRHSRNYGMTGAYQTGFSKAKGDYVLVYSSDLEIPAKHILEVVAKLDEDFDVVNTNRTGRWVSTGAGAVMRRFPSKVANSLISSISGISVKDTGSGLKGFKRYVTDNLNLHGEMHRYLLSYCAPITKKITEIDVEYHDRTYGSSNYGSLKRVFKVVLDLFTIAFMINFATKPFRMMPGRIFAFTGLVTSFVGFVILSYLAVLKFVFFESIGNRPLLSAGMIFFLLGVQLIMTGLLGELLMRVYFDAWGRSPYVVSEEL